jgi:hypothetical protein
MDVAIDCVLAVSALSVVLAVGGARALLSVLVASVAAFCVWLGALLVQHEEMRSQAADALQMSRVRCAELGLRGVCVCLRLSILALERASCAFTCLSERARQLESRLCAPCRSRGG